MLTGSFDAHPQGSDWVWAHDIIADDTDDLMNVDGCVFTLNITRREQSFRDYGLILPGFYGLTCLCGYAYPIASLGTGNGVLTAEEGTIVATVPASVTRSWPCGENRLTLDVTRNGETVRLVDLILPVTGY